MRSATRLMRSASATDDPPYFCTTRLKAAPSSNAGGAFRIPARGSGFQLLAEVRKRPLQAFGELDGRPPAEHLLRPADVRPAADRVVGRQRLVLDLALAGQRAHALRELEHGELARVAEVDRTGDLVVRTHQPQQPL